MQNTNPDIKQFHCTLIVNITDIFKRWKFLFMCGIYVIIWPKNDQLKSSGHDIKSVTIVKGKKNNCVFQLLNKIIMNHTFFCRKYIISLIFMDSSGNIKQLKPPVSFKVLREEVWVWNEKVFMSCCEDLFNLNSLLSLSALASSC